MSSAWNAILRVQGASRVDVPVNIDFLYRLVTYRARDHLIKFGWRYQILYICENLTRKVEDAIEVEIKEALTGIGRWVGLRTRLFYTAVTRCLTLERMIRGSTWLHSMRLIQATKFAFAHIYRTLYIIEYCAVELDPRLVSPSTVLPVSYWLKSSRFHLQPWLSL